MNPKTVEDVITDFKGRRSAIVKALTHDFDKFYQLCLHTSNSPNNLCLFGCPDQHWDVNLPLNSELPHPRLGINFDAHSMNRDDWLSMVAMQSEAWLHAVASYFASKLKFDNADRKRMFVIILDFPSLCQVIIVRQTTKRAKKRVLKTIEGLPEDLLVLILARLPAKDLIKYRSVCKTFCALIDHPEFVHTHLNTYKKKFGESHLLVTEPWQKKIMVRRSDTFRKVMELDYPLPLRNKSSIYEMGYINGLMLLKTNLRSDSVGLVLWNPSMNKFLHVPSSMFPHPYFRFGFGYDASCNDYKVIAIEYPEQKNCCPPGEHCREVNPGFFQVYKLSTNSWTTKSCVHPPTTWIDSQQVFVNGAIHWLNSGPKVQYVSGCEVGNSNLVVFDVCKEVFSYIVYPNPNDTNMDGYIGRINGNCPIALDGLLGLFFKCNDESYQHQVWVMEQYGVVDSWAKRYTFNLGLRHPRYLKSNGELLYSTGGSRVRSYDAREELDREIASDVFISYFSRIYCFVESLVLQNCK